MHHVQQWLMKMGVRTYTDTYFTLLDGSSPIQIGQDMPKPVGWIYGISIETDSVQPTDKSKATITQADAAKLYLYLKIGTDLYMNNVRLDRLMFYVPSGTGNSYANSERYFPVSIPHTTDLKQSYYNNPTGIGSPTAAYIPLTIYYIEIKDYNYLLKKGYLFDGTAAMPHHPHHSPQNRKH